MSFYVSGQKAVFDSGTMALIALRAKQAGGFNNEDLQGSGEVPLTKVEKKLIRSFD